MTAIQTAKRIHPLMAGAAISVTVLSLVGAAAIAGLLPSSRAVPADPAAAAATAIPSVPTVRPTVQSAQPVRSAEAPAVHRTAHVHHTTQLVQAAPSNYERPYQQQAAAPQPAAQPNYLGIGAGAVIGGLLGNQVGGGRGKTLATIAGAIGGGMVGNEVQKQAQQPPQ